MRVQVKGKSSEVSPGLESYAEKRLQKLEKYFRKIQYAEVTTSAQKSWNTVEVLVEGDGIFLRAEERRQDLYEAVDFVSKKLEEQVRRFKGKLIDRPRDNHRTPPPGMIEGELAEEVDEEAEEVEETAGAPAPETPQIVRQKRFPMKPMSPEEAALQMELLNHSFFVFQNARTDQVSVIYRRNDGNYGLIEPAL